MLEYYNILKTHDHSQDTYNTKQFLLIFLACHQNRAIVTRIFSKQFSLVHLKKFCGKLAIFKESLKILFLKEIIEPTQLFVLYICLEKTSKQVMHIYVFAFLMRFVKSLKTYLVICGQIHEFSACCNKGCMMKAWAYASQ